MVPLQGKALAKAILKLSGGNEHPESKDLMSNALALIKIGISR